MESGPFDGVIASIIHRARTDESRTCRPARPCSATSSSREMRSDQRLTISANQLTTTVVVGSARLEVGCTRMNVWPSAVTA